MQTIVVVLHILVCLSLIALVLIQHGKGADIGASFGNGASGTVFGSQGSGSFLFKLTGTLAAVFFITSIVITNFVTHDVKTQNSAQPLTGITRTVQKAPAPATPTKVNKQSVPSNAGVERKAPAKTDSK